MSFEQVLERDLYPRPLISIDDDRARWQASGRSWDDYVRTWAAEEGLHGAGRILDVLDTRFRCRITEEGPYVFADLEGTSEAEEQAAIDSGVIQATCVRYAGVRR